MSASTRSSHQLLLQKFWVTSILHVTQVVPHPLQPCAFAQRMRPECMVRKLRKCLYHGLSSVRTSAKAACQHSLRAN
jgi:hypothetical protein